MTSVVRSMLQQETHQGHSQVRECRCPTLSPPTTSGGTRETNAAPTVAAANDPAAAQPTLAITPGRTGQLQHARPRCGHARHSHAKDDAQDTHSIR
eukprot:2769777-Pleurochrysis_carterae.AAC.3